MNLDRRLLRFLRGAYTPLTWTILGGFAAGVLAIFQASLMSQVIADVFMGGQSLPQVMPIMWMLLAVIFGRGLSFFLGELSGTALARQIKARFRDLLSEKIFRLGPIYTRSKPAGEITAALLQGVDSLDAYFSQYLPQIVLAGLIPIAILVAVFPLDWITGVILMITGPLIPFFMFLIGSHAERLTKRQFAALSRMSAYLLDTLQGLRALKELGRSREQAGRIREVSEQYRETTLKVLRVTFLSALSLELLGTISTALIAVQIGLRLLYGRLDFESAFFILLITPDFYLPLRTLGLRFHASMKGVSAARQIFAILDEEDPRGTSSREPAIVRQASDNRTNVKVENAPLISFVNVSYQYKGRGEPAVSELGFEVKPGSLTALVGESGAGKSTVLSLVQRFIEPESGTIQVNGQPIAQIDPGVWRRSTAWVGQQPYIISGTISDNLRIANNNADQYKMMEACALARLDGWVQAQPDKLDTFLGECGRRLSGGQAQRLALARAFLRNAPLVLMDEPTAHLDPPEEAILERTVRELCEGRTAILIAHRLSTILRADQILVFSGGRIAESGGHVDLLAKRGFYANLVSAAGGAG